MPGQFAGGAGPVGPLEPLDAPLPELLEIGPQRVLADPSQPADLVMGQPLALQVDRLHLQLHPRMGVMKAFVVEGVDVRGREIDLDHRQGPVRA
jgi:hypothetical protein